MSETLPTSLKDKDKLSPDGSKERIHSVAKAQLMADAVKIHEDESAALRNITESAMKRQYHESRNGQIDFGDFDQELAHGEPSEQAPSLIQDQKEALDVIADIDGVQVKGLSVLAPTDAIVDQIKHNNETSDDIAETVGDAYDKLESTKR